MAAPRKYPEELRERAIRMAVDLRRDPATRSGALRRVGEQLGINPETLRNWVRPGRDRRRPPSRRHHGRGSADRRARAGDQGAAAGERDPADGVGVFRRGGARPQAEVTTTVLVDYIDQHREPVRGRADLHRPAQGRDADRPEQLLRRQDQAALSAGGRRRSSGWR